MKAQTLFQSLGIAGPAKAFSNVRGSKTAYQDLLDYVESYFSHGSNRPTTLDQGNKVYVSSLAPIYLQRPRHSLTVVGIDCCHDGSRSLLVFDPGYKPPKELKKSFSTGNEVKKSKAVLKEYRRNEKYLRRYRAFETLELVDYCTFS